MKHAGKARQAGLKIILWTFVLLMVFIVGGALAAVVGSLIVGASVALVMVWVVFAVFVLSFFRDPKPTPPNDPDAIVSPASGTVDLIEQTTEDLVMEGPCRRISIFLSVFDVHVQRAPVAGEITFLRQTAGDYGNAMRADSSGFNENILLGIESDGPSGEKLAVRLVAGLLARRIVLWIQLGEKVQRSERISLIQFGSRVDLYLPLATEIRVELGAKVKVGETVLAVREQK